MTQITSQLKNSAALSKLTYSSVTRLTHSSDLTRSWERSFGSEHLWRRFDIAHRDRSVADLDL